MAPCVSAASWPTLDLDTAAQLLAAARGRPWPFTLDLHSQPLGHGGALLVAQLLARGLLPGLQRLNLAWTCERDGANEILREEVW